MHHLDNILSDDSEHRYDGNNYSGSLSTRNVLSSIYCILHDFMNYDTSIDSLSKNTANESIIARFNPVIMGWNIRSHDIP